MIPADWPFDDPPNVATLTLRRIVQGDAPIRFVTHDDDDGMWQFLDGEEVSEDEAILVGLAEIVAHDPTVAQLADLPLGWYAVRDSVQDQWELGQHDAG
ncbi:MAG TPA: hypothetical protein VD886_17840 [Herpetosiphonaceae bacterium]|nr:hypothetical protein [Herpetosiphonaceae bacterium]